MDRSPSPGLGAQLRAELSVPQLDGLVARCRPQRVAVLREDLHDSCSKPECKGSRLAH
jgi:hypothetical protein